MNTYAVSIQWADGLSMSVVQARDKEHALGVAIVTNKDRRFPISDFIVVNVEGGSELTP